MTGREQRQETCGKFKVSLIYELGRKFQARAAWGRHWRKAGREA